MTKYEKLAQLIKTKLESEVHDLQGSGDELTIVCASNNILNVLKTLKKTAGFKFDELIDLCAVDYLYYGLGDWETTQATEEGFSRGVEKHIEKTVAVDHPRFAVVYHLLSTKLNQRLRVKTYLSEDNLVIDSAINVWKCANWFEREAYDLYGILFDGHPDLRRILTDYGFIGHPFRKDFPQSGHVEMHYDATLQKVIYTPVEITPRVLVPKVIRDDNRYTGESEKKA